MIEKNSLASKLKIDFTPKQAFLAFPACDADLIRLLATGEKACMMAIEVVRDVQKRDDMMAIRGMKKLSKSLYNVKGKGLERTSAAFGLSYVGDLRRYNYILSRCVQGSGEVPDCREQYADIMDAYDEQVDPLLQKVRFAVINECLRVKYKEAYLIADMVLANLMCNIAAEICRLYTEKVRGSEYVLCADPTDKTLHVVDSLLSGYKTYPMRATDYERWAKTLDDMVGLLAPNGLSLRKNQSIDNGIEGVIKHLQSKPFAMKITARFGIDTEWADKENDIAEKYVWVRFKPQIQL